MNHIIVILAACLSFYALRRLARVTKRMEQLHADSLAAEIQYGHEPTYGTWDCLKDLAKALVLMVLFLGCLILAFAL